MIDKEREIMYNWGTKNRRMGEVSTVDAEYMSNVCFATAAARCTARLWYI